MLTPPPDKWRNNVAAVIMDARGHVLIAASAEHSKHWHFPQGGVSHKESLTKALQREIIEEVGIRPEQYQIITSIGGFRYLYGEDNEKSLKWRGQEQTYFLLLCHEDEPKVDISCSPEFKRYMWIPWRELKPEFFVSAKRETIAQVLGTFFPSTLPKEGFIPLIKKTLTPQRYLMQCSQKCDLMAIRSDDRALFAGAKDEAHLHIAALRRDVQRLHSSLVSRRKGRLMVIFYGLDGSGCDASVRHLARCMDPFGFRVESLAGITNEELNEADFLRPYYSRTPKRGETVLFDRSIHYLLGEMQLEAAKNEDMQEVSPADMEEEISTDELRNDKLNQSSENDIRFSRRLNRILQFEEMLEEEGTRVVKIFLHSSHEERIRRLEKRILMPTHRPRLLEFILPEERDLAEEIMMAQAVISQTHSALSPWYVIPADRKWYRDLCVSRVIVETLQEMVLAMDAPAPPSKGGL